MTVSTTSRQADTADVTWVPPAVRQSDDTSHIPVRRLAPRRIGPAGLAIGPVVLVAVWQLASSNGLLQPTQLASPWTAVTSGYEMLADGELLPQLAASAKRAYLGLFFGVAFGVVAALVSGLTRVGEACVDSLVQIKRAIPTLALIPLAILWLGIGETMKIAVIATTVFVPIYINTHDGLRSIDQRYVELAQTTDVGRAEFIRKVALPGSLPGFLTGLRLAVTMCWTALVVLEQINATEGIGYVMSRARDFGQTDIIVVGLVLYAAMGLVSDGVVRAIQRRALSYRKALGS
jgi:sulfonate transport system permease protein